MKFQALLFLSATSFALGETTVTPTIDSVGLFKNGLAVVRASFPIKSSGDFVWEKIPHVVHGSLWVESDGEVVIRSTTRMIEETEEAESPEGRLQKDLAGKGVKIAYQSGEDEVSAEGIVWEIPPLAATKRWDTDYSSLNPNAGSYYWQRSQMNGNRITPSQPTTGNFLVLTDNDGTRRYIRESSISSVTVSGPFQPAVCKVEKPVLVFEVGKVPEKGGTVSITYLSKGLAWMPSYRIDLTDPKTLSIRHSAAIRNEMMDLENTGLQLISGYPNVRFGSVDSPFGRELHSLPFFNKSTTPAPVGTGWTYSATRSPNSRYT